jgi:hypothetical protein|tara:strand:+ start:241 stop:993 length:753 start_codon:yes stop_codon:yes gene_type:complete
MGFGGGGGGALPNHEHTNIALDGGPLDFVNTTIASLTAGSTTFSDGAALQELVIGNAGETLTVNGGGTAPEWAAAGGGAWVNEGSDINTSKGVDLSVSVSDADVYQILYNVNDGADISTPSLVMRINDVVTSTYDTLMGTASDGGAMNAEVKTYTKWLLSNAGSEYGYSGVAYIYKSDPNSFTSTQGGATFTSQNNMYNVTAPTYINESRGTNDSVTGAITKITLKVMKENTESNSEITGSMRVNSMSYS